MLFSVISIVFLSFLCSSIQSLTKMASRLPKIVDLPPLVLLDRDGVVNKDVGSPGVISPLQLELTPNAAQAIGSLKRKGCRVVLVTNQSCVGKGLIDEAELHQINDCLQKMLLDEDNDAILDDIYVCTSVNGSCDPRMKPGPGMIQEACRDASVEPIDCVMIGDSLRDLEAAKAGGVGCKILVSTGESLYVSACFHLAFDPRDDALFALASFKRIRLISHGRYETQGSTH